MKIKSTIKFLLFFTCCFTITLIITLLIKKYVFIRVLVSGDSMYPTFSNGNNLIMWQLGYEPKRNDIVVCENNVGGNGYIIKRCIAVEGDTVIIDYQKDKVYVNGEEIDEPYIADEDMEEIFISDEDNKHEYKYLVPDNCVFVMGDNRNVSIDSRNPDVGFINKSEIKGKILFNVDDFSFV